jgi:hypothetical protein
MNAPNPIKLRADTNDATGSAAPGARRRRQLSIALALVGGVVAIAACGSSGKAPSTVASVNQALRFSECMRSHGVTGFPDPTVGRGLELGPGADVQSPAFQSAQRACSKLQPGGGGPPRMSESEYLSTLHFAKCMRSHGLADFPDPARSSSSVGGPAFFLRGMVFKLGADLSPMSPAFRQAATACGLKLP